MARMKWIGVILMLCFDAAMGQGVRGYRQLQFNEASVARKKNKSPTSAPSSSSLDTMPLPTKEPSSDDEQQPSFLTTVEPTPVPTRFPTTSPAYFPEEAEDTPPPSPSPVGESETTSTPTQFIEIPSTSSSPSPPPVGESTTSIPTQLPSDTPTGKPEDAEIHLRCVALAQGEVYTTERAFDVDYTYELLTKTNTLIERVIRQVDQASVSVLTDSIMACNNSNAESTTLSLATEDAADEVQNSIQGISVAKQGRFSGGFACTGLVPQSDEICYIIQGSAVVYMDTNFAGSVESLESLVWSALRDEFNKSGRRRRQRRRLESSIVSSNDDILGLYLLSGEDSAELRNDDLADSALRDVTDSKNRENPGGNNYFMAPFLGIVVFMLVIFGFSYVQRRQKADLEYCLGDDTSPDGSLECLESFNGNIKKVQARHTATGAESSMVSDDDDNAPTMFSVSYGYSPNATYDDPPSPTFSPSSKSKQMEASSDMLYDYSMGGVSARTGSPSAATKSSHDESSKPNKNNDDSGWAAWNIADPNFFWSSFCQMTDSPPASSSTPHQRDDSKNGANYMYSTDLFGSSADTPRATKPAVSNTNFKRSDTTNQNQNQRHALPPSFSVASLYHSAFSSPFTTESNDTNEKENVPPSKYSTNLFGTPKNEAAAITRGSRALGDRKQNLRQGRDRKYSDTVFL